MKKFGLLITYPNQSSEFCTDKGVRIEFDSKEDADKELQKWLKVKWKPKTILYSIQEIINI